jgi:alpha-tubulin suppressor-like RCC1 family protein
MSSVDSSSQWYSFGSNSSGLLLQDNHCNDLKLPEPIKLLINKELNSSESASGLHANSIVSLQCSGMHTAILTTSGQVYLAGEINTSSNEKLIPLKFPNPVRLIAVGWTKTVIVTESDQVFSIANDDINNFIELEFPANARIQSMSCGYSHILFITTNSKLYAYGSNKYGQLGCSETVKIASTPRLVDTGNLGAISAISCGHYFSALITVNGEVYSCGLNKHGQLGLNNLQIRRSYEWQRVETLSEIQQIACGWSHCLALDKEGRVFGWGRADKGQLGAEETKVNAAPAIITDAENISLRCNAVFCGAEHSVMVAKDRCTIYFCGWNEHGNSGLGNTDNIYKPTIIRSLSTTPDAETFVATGGAAVFVRKLKQL